MPKNVSFKQPELSRWFLLEERRTRDDSYIGGICWTRTLSVFDPRKKRSRQLDMSTGDLAVLSLLLNAPKSRALSAPDIRRAIESVRAIPIRNRDYGVDANTKAIATEAIHRIRNWIVTGEVETSGQHRKALIHSPYNPITNKPGQGWWFKVSWTISISGNEDIEAEIPKPAKTIRLTRRKLQHLSWLESSQSKVMYPDYGLTAADFADLINLEQKCWEEGNDDRFYASLILGFALLKSGPLASLNSSTRLLNLRRVALLRVPESMAAKWILARAHLAWMSLPSKAAQKLQDVAAAYKLFNSITPIGKGQLRMPILLPGARQEFSEKELDDLDPTHPIEPLVEQVVFPHRYTGSTAVILAEQPGTRKKELLDEALKHCVEAEKKHPGDSAPRLNADLLRVGTRSIQLHGQQDNRSSRRDLIARVVQLEDRIAAARISEHKSHEWRANCHACLALTKVSGREYREEIEQMVAHLKDLVISLRSVPDFINIDPIYRLAADLQEPNQLRDILEELRSLPVDAELRGVKHL